MAINKRFASEEYVNEGIIAARPDWYQNDETAADYIKNRPFGETTVMGDTLTWDGNTEGLYNVLGMFYHISDAVPTLEEAQQGGDLTYIRTDFDDVVETPYDVLDLETLGAGKDCYLLGYDPSKNGNYVFTVIVVLKEGATATAQGITATFEKTGVYFFNTGTQYTSRVTINGYTGFERVEIVPLPNKYLPKAMVVDTTGLILTDGVYEDESTNFTPLYNHFMAGGDIIITKTNQNATFTNRATSCMVVKDDTGTIVRVEFTYLDAFTKTEWAVGFTTP